MFGRLLVVVYFVAGLGYLALRHLVWPNPGGWLPHAEQMLGDAIGRPIEVASVRTGFDGLHPSLEVDGFHILDDDGSPAFSAGHARFAFSLPHLALGRLRFARFEIDSPQLRVERLAPGRFKVAGIELDLALTDDVGRAPPALERLFDARRVVLRGAGLQWIDWVDGSSLRIADAALALETIGRHHRVFLSLPELPALGRNLKLALDVWRPAFSGIADWRRWDGELFLGADDADLVAAMAASRTLSGWLGSDAMALSGSDKSSPLHGVELRDGVASFRLWTDVKDGAPAKALLKLASARTLLELPGGALALDAAALEVELRQGRGGRRHLVLHQFALRGPEGLELALSAGARNLLRFDREGRLSGGALAWQGFDAEPVITLARAMPLPEAWGGPLRATKLSGRVESLALDWRRRTRRGEAGGAPFGYSVEARLDDLSAVYDNGVLEAGRLGIPSFERLSGALSFDESGGRLAVAARNAVLHFPGMFAEPAVPFDRFDSRARWRFAGPGGPAAGIEVDIEGLDFENADAAGRVAGRYRRGASGLGEVDLSGGLSRAEAKRVARYLPLEVPEKVRAWVASSVLAGRSDDLRFELQGAIADFPYREPGTGLFRIEAKVREASLDYQPGWPALRQIDARLSFEGPGLDIAVDSGRMAGLSLNSAHATLDEYRTPRLQLRAAARGPAQEMLRIVETSPVAARVHELSRALEVRGAASVELDLDIPIEDLESVRVSGAVSLPGNELVLDESLPALTGVKARLEFSERGLALRDLVGDFLGGSIRMDGETSETGRFRANLSGRASADGIRAATDNPFTRALDGMVDWRGELEFQGAARRLRVESELLGLASRLPAPFTKVASSPWPLRVELAPRRSPRDRDATPPDRDLLRVSLGDEIRLALERERDPRSKQMMLRRGALALSAEPLMPDRGFSVRLHAPEVDVDAWAALLGPALAATIAEPIPVVDSAASGFSFLPGQLSVIAGRLRLAGKDFHEVVLGATRSGSAWRASVGSREIDGLIDWRGASPGQAGGALSARLARLEIPQSQVREFESLLDHLPPVLPALDVVAEEFVLNERRLGRLKLEAVNVGSQAAPVWRLDGLEIEHLAATLKAGGTWQTDRATGQRRTELGFELALRDAGGVLETLGFPGTMRGGAGALTGMIEWVGSPLALDYRTLSGALTLRIGKGQFLRAEPGIAKLIGVLNLQSLRRRLSFDFRDLFAEGFAFERIDGNATLSRGVARTDDFTMRGFAAEVRLRGSADLAAETQDLHAEVRPELNAGLASLAYAALANPAIGLGSFVAQLLLSKPLQELFSWEYELSGSWDDPQVTRLSRPVPETPPSGG